MPAIPGLRTPRQFYWVMQQPAPLAGMAYPGPATPWQAITAAGFRQVVCLAGDAPGYDPGPLQRLYTANLEDLFHGKPPQDPEREAGLIREAVGAVFPRLQSGEGVIVHCAGGTGRTGTLVGCILRRLGLPAWQVLDYLNELHQARGKPGWPESAWQAWMVENFKPEA